MRSTAESDAGRRAGLSGRPDPGDTPGVGGLGFFGSFASSLVSSCRRATKKRRARRCDSVGVSAPSLPCLATKPKPFTEGERKMLIAPSSAMAPEACAARSRIALPEDEREARSSCKERKTSVIHGGKWGETCGENGRV